MRCKPRRARDARVVILSDHGFHLGNSDRFPTTTVWEQAAGVPLIVHDPDRPAAREVHGPVALIDLGPTILDHAGTPPMEGSVGLSLRPQVERVSRPDRVVPTFPGDTVGVRRGDHRFVRYADVSTQPFDVRDDYRQLRDPGADHPANADMHLAEVDGAREYGLRIGQSTAWCAAGSADTS